MSDEGTDEAMIRVLIVDDSSMIRRIVQRAVRKDPRMIVAGAAPSGESALAMIPELDPDVVLLDVSMPGMDGLEVLDVIRKRHDDLPVIIFSSLAERGTRVAFEAIARGASDHMPKPTGDVQSALGQLLDKLVTVVEVRKRRHATRRAATVEPPPRSITARASTHPPELVVIGSSTGGPNALAELIDGLPSDLSVPIVVVQHMPPVLTRFLAKRLDSRTPLTVFEAGEGDLMRPGTIAIAPGDHHLELVRSRDGFRAVLTDAPPENSCRPSVDVLFRTAAKLAGPGVLAVVLTGMGQDGLQGCRAIWEAGGRIFTQRGDTCVVWGMPRVVEEAGLAHEVIPLPEIAGRIHSTLLGRV